MAAVRKTSSSDNVSVTNTGVNEVLKLDSALPLAVFEAPATERYSYQLKLLRITTCDGVESRIKLVNATWYLDGAKKFNESSVNVQVHLK